MKKKQTNRQKHARKTSLRAKLRLEPLESRLLLSASPFGHGEDHDHHDEDRLDFESGRGSNLVGVGHPSHNRHRHDHREHDDERQRDSQPLLSFRWLMQISEQQFHQHRSHRPQGRSQRHAADHSKHDSDHRQRQSNPPQDGATSSNTIPSSAIPSSTAAPTNSQGNPPPRGEGESPSSTSSNDDFRAATPTELTLPLETSSLSTGASAGVSAEATTASAVTSESLSTATTTIREPAAPASSSSLANLAGEAGRSAGLLVNRLISQVFVEQSERYEDEIEGLRGWLRTLLVANDELDGSASDEVSLVGDVEGSESEESSRYQLLDAVFQDDALENSLDWLLDSLLGEVKGEVEGDLDGRAGSQSDAQAEYSATAIASDANAQLDRLAPASLESVGQADTVADSQNSGLGLAEVQLGWEQSQHWPVEAGPAEVAAEIIVNDDLHIRYMAFEIAGDESYETAGDKE